MSTKQAYWFSIMAEQEQSGLTIRAFCTAKDIKLCTFHYWRKRYRQAHDQDGGFVEIAGPAVRSSTLRLTYPNGVCIDLPAPDMALIAQLLRLG